MDLFLAQLKLVGSLGPILVWYKLLLQFWGRVEGVCASMCTSTEVVPKQKLNQNSTNVQVRLIGMVYKPSVRFWSLELVTSFFMLDYGSLLACLGEN
jgi:hypothetical protein